jgi:hypothetical protein
MSGFRNLFAVLAAIALAGGCATTGPRPAPLAREDIVLLAKSGATAPQIVERLRETGTVLELSATDILQMSESGVPREALDYLQAVQIADLRQRLQFERMLYGPGMSPFSRCGRYGRAPFNRFGSPYWPSC